MSLSFLAHPFGRPLQLGSPFFQTFGESGYLALRWDRRLQNALERAALKVGPPSGVDSLSLWEEHAQTGCLKALGARFRERMQAISFLAAAGWVAPERLQTNQLASWLTAICREPTWLGPAHALEATRAAHPPAILDVHCAMTATLLCWVAQLHGPRLAPSLRRLLGSTLRERVVLPFLDGTHWWLGQVPGRRVNNFAPLCCAAALMASVTVPETTEAERSAISRLSYEGLQRYLETFSPDGGCEEGASYWVYGMDAFVLAAELLRNLPEAYDFYAHPLASAIASYPLSVAVGPDDWLLYSDCQQTARWNPGTLALLGNRLALPSLSRLARAHHPDLCFLARQGTLFQALLWWPPPGATSLPTPPANVHFKGFGFFITRIHPTDPAAPVITLCAGDNGRPHNHNDLGHLSYYLNGEALLAELGAPEYTQDYFSPRRCTYLAASSRGHSVPVVNGIYQGRGSGFRAEILEHRHGEAEVIRLNLAQAYPAEAGLERLERTVWIDRKDQPGKVRLTDAYRFRPGCPGGAKIESVLVTTGRVEIREGEVRLEGERKKGHLRVLFDSGALSLDTETMEEVALYEAVARVTFLKFSPRLPAESGTLSMEIHPGPPGEAGQEGTAECPLPNP